MTREEFEYQKKYGRSTVVKWGTYTDSRIEEARQAAEEAMCLAAERYAAQEEIPEEPAPVEPEAEAAPAAHMMSFPMTANMDEVDESTLTDAERFARELEKKQASRIQDDVLGMVASVQAKQAEKDAEAEAIAARAMAQAEDRIQDNVARLFAENAKNS